MHGVGKRIAGGLASAGLLLTASACAGGGAAEETNAGGTSIEYGAEKAEYRDALADMDPVELSIQSTGPKGSATGKRFEDYAAAVEDWSDGKITFEFTYSNGVAPPEEVYAALADGRLDVGSVMPNLTPDEFPAYNAMSEMSYLGSQLPVDWMLEWHGIMLQTAAETEEIDSEFTDHGLKLLLPVFGSGAYMPYCVDPGDSLDDLEGRGIAIQSKVQSSEAEALGMSGSTITYSEMYEGLQRGVIDCAMSTVTGAALGGFIDAAPHVFFDPKQGFDSPGGTITFSLATWNELPLAAQQLLYDRLDVLLQANFEGAWDNTDAAIKAVKQAGGSFAPVDEDTSAALTDVHEGVVDQIVAGEAVEDGQAVVDAALEAAKEWAKSVKELGIDGIGTSYDEFGAWYAQGIPDLQPYFDQLWDGAMGERRPS